MARRMRTFGWVQDPGEIKHLRKVVELFYFGSKTHTALIKKLIPKLVSKRDGRDRFLRLLKTPPIKIKYIDLVGTAFKPRAISRANGIVQVAIPGQKRPFLSDWAADNFIRWAHALGLIIYFSEDDSFSISELGKAYVETKEGSKEEKEILIQTLLSYPPVMRILNLLANGSHLTKFELGKKLGFIGENGFTTLPQNILIQELATEKSAKMRNKMLSDWDGSSDKYARTIASWLKQIGWIRQVPKEIEVKIGNSVYKYTLPQAYLITKAGLKARRRGLGINIKTRIPKNVYWEMLSTKGPDRDYIRTRRAYILKFLEKSSKGLSIQEIQNKLTKLNFKETLPTIENDLNGLMNIGLNIQLIANKYFLKDTMVNLEIPKFAVKEVIKGDIQKLIDECREKLTILSPEYLLLIPLSFDEKESRLFEMKTVELLTQECGFSGIHLGGADEPDGIVYTRNLPTDYGIILDTKTSKAGFVLTAHQRREMVGYIYDNIFRPSSRLNQWWENFPSDLEDFKFLFVSSRFRGRLENQLKRIKEDTKGQLGAAINSYNLLILADYIKKGKTKTIFQRVNHLLGCLKEILEKNIKTLKNKRI